MSAKIRSFDDFLALFPESPRKKIPRGWNVICPAHQDRDPSLSVTLKDSRILVKCQAGCKTEDVVKLKGLTLADLFLNSYKPKPDQRTPKKLVATFSYQDATGVEQYQIRRFEPKDFQVWHKDKSGKYVPGLGGAKPILYHLPEIPRWIAAGKRIYLPEGEGKADLIISRGGAATTSPFGAGPHKWRPEYSKALVGAEVIIPPDNDKPGHDFTQDKAASLYTTAKSVKVLELPGLPEKGDVFDWFNNGGSFEQLEQLANEAPEYRPTSSQGESFSLTPLGDLLAEPEEAVPWLWDRTLPVGGLSLLASKPKVGKTTFARNLALAVARGEPFLGRATTKGAVVYLALEEKRAQVAAHFARMGATDEPIVVHFGQAPEKGLEELGRVIRETGAALAIVDPIMRLIRLRDSNDYAEVTRSLEPLLMLARNTGCHILAVHHESKGAAFRETGDGILGSTALFGSVDTALILRRREDARTLESQQRYGEDFPRSVLSFDRETGTLEAAGTVEALEMKRVGEAILEALGEGELSEGELSEGELRKEIGGNTGLVGKTLRHLVAEGQVARMGEGKRGDPFRYKRILVSCLHYIDKQEKREKQETEPQPAPSGACEGEL